MKRTTSTQEDNGVESDGASDHIDQYLVVSHDLIVAFAGTEVSFDPHKHVF